MLAGRKESVSSRFKYAFSQCVVFAVCSETLSSRRSAVCFADAVVVEDQNRHMFALHDLIELICIPITIRIAVHSLQTVLSAVYRCMTST